jgi:hypothetical protein
VDSDEWRVVSQGDGREAEAASICKEKLITNH